MLWRLLRAKFVSILKLTHVFTKYVLAFFAGHHNFLVLQYFVVLLFFVALWAVEPLFTANGADLYLSVSDVFAHFQI